MILWLVGAAFAGDLVGSLADPLGKPVENATLVVYDQRLNYATALSGADGVFRFVDLPPNHYRVRVLPPRGVNLAEQYLPSGVSICAAPAFTVGEGTTEVGDLRLTFGARIQGRVVDDEGHPIAGAQVAARTLQGEPQLAPRYATTGEDGHFSVEGAKPTYRHKLEISASGWPRQLAPGEYVEENAGVYWPLHPGEIVEIERDVVLRRGVSVSGRVYGPDGPVREGEVQAFTPSQLVAGPIVEGFFEVGGLPPGDVLVWANGPGLAQTYYPNADRPGQRIPSLDGDIVGGVELHMPPAGRVTGRLPVTGDLSAISVIAYNDDRTVGVGAPVASDGAFVVDALHPGSYSLHVFGAKVGLVDDLVREPDGSVRTVVVPEGGEGDFGDLDIPLGGIIQGTVRERYTDAPVYGAYVYAQRLDSETGLVATSEGDGSYILRGLQPGTWRLWVEYQAWCGSDPDYVSRYYPDQINPLFIGAVTLRVGQTAEWHATVPPDDDQDGMDDVWEADMGLDPSRDDADEDPDGDGYTNREEYLLGTHPLIAESRPSCGCNGDRATLVLPALLLWSRRRRRDGRAAAPR